jgi:DNA-binding CsgD family transcriptional regulator
VVLVERERELAAIDAVVARGGVLVIEGGAGIGKTVLLDAAASRAGACGYRVLRACGSELETGFAFGVVRQLFERPLAAMDPPTRDELLAGAAAATRPLVLGDTVVPTAVDTSFAVLHGLYWLVTNLAERGPLALVVDDTQWADAPSMRGLAHLVPRIEGLPVALVIATRPADPVAGEVISSALRDGATVVRPALLSERAVTALVRAALGPETDDAACNGLFERSGGNPFYLAELLRAPDLATPGDLVQQVVGRVRQLDPDALALAQAAAILGDGFPLRLSAALAGLDAGSASSRATGLTRLEVLAGVDPPRFLHPVIRDAVGASLASDARDDLHRRAAHLLYDERAPVGQVAAHLVRLRTRDDAWVVDRLRDAARDAMHAGAPQAAAELLLRALDEPPTFGNRVAVLRELAGAEVRAGRETACDRLDEALALTDDGPARAAIALEMAEAYASLFRWVDAVDVIDRALAELDDADPALAARLEGELVVAGLHDARRATRVGPTLDRLGTRHPTGAPAEARAVATGMAMVLGGRPADEAAVALESALACAAPVVENWDTRAALLWSLIAAERYDAVRAALEPMLAQVQQSGTARGLVATYSTLGLLELRVGALPEADSAARVALRVLQEGDFAPGLAFGATVLADVAIEAGQLDDAEVALALLPAGELPAGVGTVLIPAARGRLRYAQGRYGEARRELEQCAAMFSAEAWGVELHDVGYLHARSGAALARLRLGDRDGAVRLAEAELADVRAFGARRALGVSARVAGLVRGSSEGVELLAESVAALRDSPAQLERAKSLVELGAALRRAGRRSEAREPLTEALDLAARCGARPLAARAREELVAAGARPRRDRRQGREALTPGELRVAQLAMEGMTNRQIAQELYVTTKTVEGHLARAFGKLGISGRGELRTALGA